MLQYEDSRTQSIVARLINLSRFIQGVILLGWMVGLGFFFSAAVALVNPDLWWAGGLAGLILGFGVGRTMGSLLVALLEWMAQLLVAQGEILAHLKRQG